MYEWIKVTLLASSVLVRAVDGDTLQTAEGLNIRLQGFNAPETFNSHCPSERALGLRAKARLSALLPQAELRIVPGNCAYGRSCGVLSIGGKNVAETLISEGLAEPMLCPTGRCPRPKDWCNG